MCQVLVYDDPGVNAVKILHAMVSLLMLGMACSAEPGLAPEDDEVAAKVIDAVYFRHDENRDSTIHLVRKYPIVKGAAFDNDLSYAVYSVMYFGIVEGGMLLPSSEQRER